MKRITHQALKDRARVMLEAMTAESRWIYALEPDRLALAASIMDEEKIPRVEDAAGATVLRFASETPTAQYLLFHHPELGVVFLQGDGDAAVPVMKRILGATGFIAQSRLWKEALDVGTDASTRALKILAHMLIGWDDDWSDLFILYLASPDPMIRHDATIALAVAGLVSRETAPARDLLAQAQARESFPKLAETMAEAGKLLEAWGSETLDLAALPPLNHPNV
jgi:hypothetical protein